MSRGCPAIGSDVGGIPELLDDKVIFPSEDTDALAVIIESSFSDKEYLRSQAKRNFKRVMRYQAVHLDQKRQKFLMSFKMY